MTTKNVVTARDLETCMHDLFSSGKSYAFDEIYKELMKQYPFPNITKMLERFIGQGIVRLDERYYPGSGGTHSVNFQINV